MLPAMRAPRESLGWRTEDPTVEVGGLRPVLQPWLLLRRWVVPSILVVMAYFLGRASLQKLLALVSYPARRARAQTKDPPDAMFRTLAAIALASAVAVATFGCQSSSLAASADTPPAPEPPRLGLRGQFPPGLKVFINQRGVIVRIQDPDFHMAVARRAYAHGRHTLAANEVEKVRGGVGWFEERASGARHKRLGDAMRALRMLERQLRRHEVDSIRVLDGVFQDTLRGLAGDYSVMEDLAETDTR